MGAEAGSSLLMHVGLLGMGYVLGRVQLLPLTIDFYYELCDLPMARKALLGGSLLVLITVYMLVMYLPLRRIADLEARKSQECGSVAASPTSFRRELRRRGSYSMSYVTDIKAHVFARTETL